MELLAGNMKSPFFLLKQFRLSKILNEMSNKSQLVSPELQKICEEINEYSQDIMRSSMEQQMKEAEPLAKSVQEEHYLEGLHGFIAVIFVPQN